ncbi:MAG TPA: hypothetical protein VK988_12980, partial [Acidimicrobiales bacterium]|nr:hypothetical protein [Acidimicrobiales bacterium]
GTSPGPAAGPGAVGAGGVEAGGIGAGGVGAGASSRVSPLRGTRSGGTGSLPRTGGPLRPLTGTGLVLVLAGGLILGVARRRSCAE